MLFFPNYANINTKHAEWYKDTQFLGDDNLHLHTWRRFQTFKFIHFTQVQKEYPSTGSERPCQIASAMSLRACSTKCYPWGWKDAEMESLNSQAINDVESWVGNLYMTSSSWNLKRNKKKNKKHSYTRLSSFQLTISNFKGPVNTWAMIQASHNDIDKQ